MKYFNPLMPFQSFMLEGFRNLGHRWLVSQYYGRGHNPLERDKTPILLTPYDDIGLAKGHLGAVFADPYKAIVDLDNAAHFQKLDKMCDPASKYIPFVAAIADARLIDIRKNRKLAEMVRVFIGKRTKWTIARVEDVGANLELRFGELYMTVAYNGETVTERMTVVEHAMLTECATMFPSLRVFH